MLLSLTSQSADFVFSPFLLANVLLRKNDVFTHCTSSCSSLCWIQEFLYSQNTCMFIWAFQQQHLPWARSTLAASSVQMHSSYKKRNNAVFLLMSTIREAGKLSSGFFKIFFLLIGKISSKSCQGRHHSVGGNGLKLQHFYS